MRKIKKALRKLLSLFSRLFCQSWSDGRKELKVLTPLGLWLYRMWTLTPLGNRALGFLGHRVDYEYYRGTDDSELIRLVLGEYEKIQHQYPGNDRRLPLSIQWDDFSENLKRSFDAESIRGFRRNRLCIGGYIGGGSILEEKMDVTDAVAFSGNYTIARKANIFRERWNTAATHRFGLRRLQDFHHLGRFIDPGLLAAIEEDRTGNPILPVHQDKHISWNLLRYAYFSTNILRYVCLPLKPDGLVLCEIGGGYGGFARVFKKTHPNVCYVNFDLPESILLATYYLKANFPEARFATSGTLTPGMVLSAEVLKEYDFVLLPWWYVEYLAPRTVDLFFNSASMQEMMPKFVDYYIGHIQRCSQGYFYWINREIAPERYGGTRFEDYPLDEHWRTVYTRSMYESPVRQREWLAARTV